MTYEEKIYQFLLQAKAEMQEVFIRENKLKRKRKLNKLWYWNNC